MKKMAFLLSLILVFSFNSFAGGKDGHQGNVNKNVVGHTGKKAREKHYNLNNHELDELFKELANKNIRNESELKNYFGIMISIDFPCKTKSMKLAQKLAISSDVASDFVDTYQHADFETIKMNYKRFVRHAIVPLCHK